MFPGNKSSLSSGLIPTCCCYLIYFMPRVFNVGEGVAAPSTSKLEIGHYLLRRFSSIFTYVIAWHKSSTAYRLSVHSLCYLILWYESWSGKLLII